MGNLRNENLSLLEQLNLMGGKSKRSIYIDDSLLKGGFRVVNTIKERDEIDCCHRKWGMKVLVVGPLLDFKEYILKSRKCRDNIWEEAQGGGLQSVNETQVTLVEDYSELEQDLITQRDLNLALKRAILQLQQEVIDIPTNTSEFINDGEDGINKFITAQDIPVVVLPTKTSDLINDGEGIDPFITLAEVPAQTPQVNSDWDAVSGPEEILNKPTIPVIVPQEQSDWDAVSGVSFIKNKPTIPIPVDISGKLDKPTTDGTWAVQKSGATITYVAVSSDNISNANLTWTVDRTQNLGAKKLTFTNGRFSVPTLEMEVTSANSIPNKSWTDGVDEYQTNNAGINYKKITDRIVNVDKTGNSAYTKVMVIHPTTKETVVRDFADPAATTLAVQNANTTQKTAMRTALLGSATPASPVINYVLPLFLIRGIDQFLYITGINLTLLDPTNIYFIDATSIRRDAYSYFNISGTEVQTIWNIPISTPLGTYPMKILNGSVIQGASNGVVQVVDSSDLISKDVFPSESIVRVIDDLPINTAFLFTKNNITIPKIPSTSTLPAKPDITGTISVKTDNFLKGIASSSWDITLTVQLVGAGNDTEDQPAFGLSETTNAEFTSVQSLVKNCFILKGVGPYVKVSSGITSLGYLKFGIRKTGNQVIFLLYTAIDSNSIKIIQTHTIDTSKNYALFFSQFNNSTGATNPMLKYEILSIKIKD